MAGVKLTDAFVKGARCEPGRRLREFRDEGVRGLELRVTCGGSKSWRLHYTRRSDGKRRVVGLGSYPSMSLKDARTKAKRVQADIEDRETRADPAAGVRERRAAPTFNELADDWLDRHARPNKSPRAVRDDISMLDRHVLPRIGAMRATGIAKRDIIRMLDEISAKSDARAGRDPGRRMTHRPNRVFELVRAIFRWAVGRDLLQIDPTWGLSPPIKREKPRERNLSQTEIRQLWRALDRAPSKRRTTRRVRRGEADHGSKDLPFSRAIATALKLSLVTGQRIGEVAGMSIAELDLNETAPTWTVPAERSKNGHANRVPLSPLALKLIADARALACDSPWIFPSPSGGASIDAHAPTRAVHRGRDALGVPDFRAQDLRRTAATRMAEMGISPHTISLVLNHVSARKGTVTGKVYVQYSYDREKRGALEAWGEKLATLVDGP